LRRTTNLQHLLRLQNSKRIRWSEFQMVLVPLCHQVRSSIGQARFGCFLALAENTVE
jgi:DNA-binding cell septation regulator SpoVG